MHASLLIALCCCYAMASAAEALSTEEQVQQLYRAGSEYYLAKQFDEAKEVWLYLKQIIPQVQLVCEWRFLL
jgi:hypothetical protein